MARSKSIWKVENYTAKNGKKYQRYVHDTDGNKILRDNIDLSTIDPEQLKPKEKSTKPKPKRICKLTRKKIKRLIPDYIVEEMRQATSLRSCYFDGKSDTYTIIINEEYVNGRDSGWAIVRISKTKTQSDKMVFFNIRTKEWKPFNKEVDKPSIGNTAIIWPTMPESVAEENEKVAGTVA